MNPRLETARLDWHNSIQITIEGDECWVNWPHFLESSLGQRACSSVLFAPVPVLVGQRTRAESFCRAFLSWASPDDNEAYGVALKMMAWLEAALLHPFELDRVPHLVADLHMEQVELVLLGQTQLKV